MNRGVAEFDELLGRLNRKRHNSQVGPNADLESRVLKKEKSFVSVIRSRKQEPSDSLEEDSASDVLEEQDFSFGDDDGSVYSQEDVANGLDDEGRATDESGSSVDLDEESKDSGSHNDELLSVNVLRYGI